ncbi:uncharacterized protein EV420DRAFT_1578172 [Desarmillaria tabescens]|uniref:Uncharacterized protein n=1 Tax=Armillaria tabescens TaxID=1929756 RepID=A0AA39JJH8_ARMTA|nr:uncharacterized protein EV420DRAFT_1581563 [Desarmillaria tabescens]XP_060324297.1 uncharacterized protein EV420DRAFT_1578172 [Desarmillaria tabescens]KAK0440440.1 hypothetical protein EV420DRAFT_1581563 [Desarmillaria tabescens]KAK0442479.1 hypothetical protein EV420DRAFT_1578172 [Desarmillaria tabescens]
MLVQFILFCFHFTTSAGFHFDPVEGNATVGTSLTLTWYRDQGDPQEFKFKRRNSTQYLGQGDPVPFTPPDSGTTDGTVMVNFPNPGKYTIDVIVDKSGLVPMSPLINVINRDPLSTTTTGAASTPRDTQSTCVVC